MRPQRVALMAYFGVATSVTVLSLISGSAELFCVVVGVMVLFLGMVPGSALAIIPTLARNPSEQAQGYGLLAQFGNIGATVGPPTFATAIAVYGLSGLVVLILCICCFGMLFSLWLVILKPSFSSIPYLSRQRFFVSVAVFSCYAVQLFCFCFTLLFIHFWVYSRKYAKML